jgi:hypothetical protein
VRRTTPKQFPEALDHLQLGTVARSRIPLQRRVVRQDLLDQRACMPRRLVHYDDDTPMSRGGISPRDSAQMPGTGLLPVAILRSPLPLGLRGPFHQAGGQAPTDQMQSATEVQGIMAIEVAHHRPMAFAPQGGAQGRKQGKTRLILA